MKAALIGYGYWGKILRRYLETHEAFSLCRIFRPTPSSDALFTNCIDEIWDDTAIDAVFLASPSAVHLSQVMKAIETGKHVFCEKPLCRMDEDVSALEMLECAPNAPTVYVDYIYTVSRSICRMKKLLPEIGPIRHIHISIRQYGRFYPESVYEVLGVHGLSVLLYLLDGQDGTEPDIDQTDLFLDAEGRAQSGVWRILWQGISCEIHVSLLCGNRERTIDVFGERGYLHCDMTSDTPLRQYRYSHYKKPESADLVWEYTYDESNNLTLALDAFAQCIRTGTRGNFQLATMIQALLAHGQKVAQQKEPARGA